MSWNPTHSRRWVESLTKLMVECSAESVSYGKCVALRMGNVQKGECEKEWQALMSCISKKRQRKR